jgi:hypothetical protein
MFLSHRTNVVTVLPPKWGAAGAVTEKGAAAGALLPAPVACRTRATKCACAAFVAAGAAKMPDAEALHN